MAMKKLVLGLSLALAALGFLMSPTSAAADSAARVLSAADQSFLASLAESVGRPAAIPAAKRPRGDSGTGWEKSWCLAFANCWDGSSLSCVGNVSCSGADSECPWEQGYITCNGRTTWCPSITCPP
jgi:hypothetical protein